MIKYFYKLLPLLLITNFCCSNENLNSLSLEQKKHTVSIISAIHKISYESNIELIFPDKSSKYFKIPYLLKDFKRIAEKDNAIADYINTLPKLKMKEAKGID